MKGLTIGTSPMVQNTCPVCGRDFLKSTSEASPDLCLGHCTPACCRKAGCRYTVPTQRAQQAMVQATIKCIVCHTPRKFFERFAPCDDGCYRVWFRGSRDPRYGKCVCSKHAPRTKPRFHRWYCSLKCYNSWDYGHHERELQGRRRRARRHPERQATRNYQRQRGGQCISIDAPTVY